MEIKQIIKENNFEFKKKFGQNFITDSNLLYAICDDAEIDENDEVLEIGVGAGTLTKILSQRAKKVVGYEIDKALVDVLKMSLSGCENVEVIFKDFLREEQTEIAKNFSRPFKVVANLPYYITTNIIFKLIEEDFNVESLTLMVQKEVAERLTAKFGTKDYGTITAELGAIGDVKITRIVDRKMFFPEPNVDSAVINIKLNRKKYKIADWQTYQQVVRASFSMRRKTLSNCLKTNFKMSAESIHKLFLELGFDENVRGEALSIEQFVNLSNSIKKYL